MKVFTMKMEILLEPMSNKLLKDRNHLIHSYRVVCFETFRLVPAKLNSYCQAFNVKSLNGEIVSPKKSHVKLEGQIKSKYALESLKKYGFESCDPVDTPMVEKSKLDEDREGKAVDPSHYLGMIGTLLYLIASRPDLQFAICMCARQKSAAISSTEAEYIALSGCCAQILWMRSQLSDYGLAFNKILMYCDNKSVIALCCNNVQHSRSKHIDIRYHFIKEQVEQGVIELYFVNTEYQLADLFTKALGRDRIEFLTNKLGMRSFTPETLKKLMNEDDE
nr:retrotransposon protein, putative, unclassified [Tanacetum cinerariifolium]GFA20239.1 retrotransposon protein, putative, unclassified [Tanacetum cinerariifolium]